MIKKKLISILLGITVFLLLFNLVVELFTSNKTNKTQNVFSVAQAENILLNTINDFGIPSEWVKIKNKKFSSQDSLHHIIIISLPEDLPLPILIKDLKKNYPDSLLVVSTEVQKHGNSIVQLFADETQLLEVQFSYEKELVRPFCSFSFIMEPLESIDEIMLERIIRHPHAFSLMIIPSFSNEKEIEKLKGLDKNYVVLLNDEIPDNKLILSGVTVRQRLRGAIQSIIKSFGEGNYYLIDDKSSVYNSSSMNFIQEEFSKNKVSLHKLSRLVNLSEKGEEESKSILRFYSSSSPADTCISFRIDIEKYLSLEKFISEYKKKGHRIIFIGEAVQQKNTKQDSPQNRVQ